MRSPFSPLVESCPHATTVCLVHALEIVSGACMCCSRVYLATIHPRQSLHVPLCGGGITSVQMLSCWTDSLQRIT